MTHRNQINWIEVINGQVLHVIHIFDQFIDANDKNERTTSDKTYSQDQVCLYKGTN
jgi:hypothetical protein